MSFDFNEYEKFGRGLQNGPDEVHFRNSVSRGYYAFYHRVKTFFGHPDGTYVTHEVLINELLSDNRLRRGAKLSNYMRTCKNERVQADYYKTPTQRHLVFNSMFCQRFWGSYDVFIELLNQESINEDDEEL